MSKYKNKKTVIDGITFDSIMESKYYLQLVWLLKHKQIKSFRVQPRYELLEGFEKNGKKYRKIEYVADFEIEELDGSITVVDVKTLKLDVFKIKEKMFVNKYDYKFVVLTYAKNYGGWIELDELERIKRKNKRKKE